MIETLEFTEITKVSDTKLRITFDVSVGPAATCTLEVKPEGGTSHSSTGTRYDDSNRVFEFSALQSPFCYQIEFILNCFDNGGDRWMGRGKFQLDCKYHRCELFTGLYKDKSKFFI